MASEPSAEDLSETLDVSPTRLLRALHAYNMAVGLDLGAQRPALLRGLYASAGQDPPEDVLLLQMLALGPVAELSSLPGLSRRDLHALVETFGRDDLAVHLQELLAELTGVTADVPEAELPPTPDPAAAAFARAALDDRRWDVVFCGYDVHRRRHRLTLLRGGGWVEGPVLPEDADQGAPDPDAEALLGVMFDTPLGEEDLAALRAQTRAFHTPPCPDQDALIAELVAAHGPLDQLYLLEVLHDLPNPAQLEQRFAFREVGARGRLQELSRRYGYRPAGLSLSGVEAELSARWDSPAQLREQQRGQRYQPPLLQSDNLSALPMSAGWQLRQGWRVSLRPLTDGPTLPVEVSSSLAGLQQVRGDGHLQERFLLQSAQVAGIHDGADYIAHSGEAPPEPPGWPAGASLGAGELSVLIGNREVPLGAAGELLQHELRPVPSVVPRLAHTRRWSAPTPPRGAGTLSGVTVVEQTARMSDAMTSAQVKATASVKTDTRCGLVAQVGGRLAISIADDTGPGHIAEQGDGAALWIHPEAGTVYLDGEIRWRLCWQVRETSHTARWQTPIELVSGTSTWSASEETVRDPVDAAHTLAVKRVSGAYWLEAVPPAQATPAERTGEE